MGARIDKYNQKAGTAAGRKEGGNTCMGWDWEMQKGWSV